MDTFAIVGGGLAAATAADTLRGGGFAGRLVLVGSEHHLPYERPPLSKGYLLDAEPLENAFVHPPEWYDENEIDLRLGTTVESIDLDHHTLATDQGPIGYDRLLVATGATARRLPVADDSGAPVAYLRTIEDSQRLKADLGAGRRVVIVGGGWIGLEVAAAARTAGCDVTVLEALDLPLVRILGPEVAEVFAGLHRSHGVDVRTNVSVTAVSHDDGRTLVHLVDQEPVAADLLVVGVGAVPNEALAAASGLETDDGILADEHLCTSHPDVFTAGDVANAYHPQLQRRVRVEHWDNAIHQGRVAAENMLGAAQVHDRLPYFFTDQYDLGMEYVGSIPPEGYDHVVVRGDVSGRVFTALWLDHRGVVAGMHVNDWDTTDQLRDLVTRGAVDLDRALDPAVPLEQLVE